ncbi:LTXXQ motif family protein [Chelatococcus asaccharovorans]|uniref:LTXXQ motif family protein n=2 Tax=Chelatococcus asaccharovorans TaxID=28210 RepID=A0A2V3U400_9HYPH|nr:LTXXQ motif family protein [Chelatococcus asaccharovorans]
MTATAVSSQIQWLRKIFTMNRTTMNRTLVATLMGALVITAPAAQAQTVPSAGVPQEPPAVELYSAADAQAVLEARLLALKTVMTLSPEQQKLWPPVEAAIRAAAKLSAERRVERAKAPPPADFVDILDRIADAEAMRAKDLKMVTHALKPLVAALTPEQQRRIPAFLGLREGTDGLPQPTAEIWLFEEEN